MKQPNLEEKLSAEEEKIIRMVPVAGFIINFLFYQECLVVGKALENEIIGNYLSKSFACAIVYYGNRVNSNRTISTFMALGGAGLIEFMEKRILSDRGYDPKDFAAYALGTVLAVSIDCLLLKKNKNP